MSDTPRIVGKWGETIAAEYLKQKGYAIIARNFRTPYGELDLVACDPAGDVVFVEVKTRRSRTLGPPEISVTPKKRDHLRAAAAAYCLKHGEIGLNWRIDVIAVTASSTDRTSEITHFENAVHGE